MSDDGGKTWRDRKAAVRASYKKILDQVTGPEDAASTTPETPGNVPSERASTEAPSAMGDGPPSATSDTSVTVTVLPATPSDRPGSSTPAENMNGSSAPSMVWMEPLTGFVANNSKKNIVGPNGLLVAGIAPWVHESLHRLAIGRAEPVEEVVQQIAEFFIEAEDERAEGPLLDALEFYCANYVGGWV